MTKYQPYTVQDVRNSSARELFTVVSTFAGGGGSSTGYRLAGG
jgi:DNA (cytosine-5)-methyltransferase 1